jgi:hypothetical protein
MRKFFLLLMLCAVTLGGCGDVDWFPEQGVTQFSFEPATGVAPGEVVTSEAITVKTRNDEETIQVTGGEYSIGDAEFTPLAGKVRNGDTVRVRHTASSQEGKSVTTTLTIGDKSAPFTSTTGTRLVFDQPLIRNATPNTQYTSSTETVDIPSGSATVSVTGGTVSINDGPFVASGEIRDGQTVRVRQQSAAAGSTGAAATTVTELKIGNMTSFFTTSITGTATLDVTITGTTNTEVVQAFPSLVSGDYSLGIKESSQGVATVSVDGVDFWDVPYQKVSLEPGQSIFVRESIFPSSAVITVEDGGTVLQRINVTGKAQ